MTEISEMQQGVCVSQARAARLAADGHKVFLSPTLGFFIKNPPYQTGDMVEDLPSDAFEVDAVSGWGGARPGAGRKPIASETMEVSLVLPLAMAEKATRIGEGNRSDGIRRAIEAFREIDTNDD